MSSVTKIFNVDGTYQSVRVTEGSSVIEIVRGLAQRHNVAAETCALYRLVRREKRTVEGSSSSSLDRKPVEHEDTIDALENSEKPFEVILNAAKNGLVCLMFGSRKIDTSKIDTAAFFQPGDIEIHQEATSANIIAQENFFNLDNFKCDMCGEMLLLKLPYDTERSALNRIPWRRQWFVLHGEYLWHTTSRTAGKLVEFIPLADNSVHKTTGSSMARYAFEIRTSTHIYILRAKTEEETSKWFNTIRYNIELSTENSLIAVAEFMIADASVSATMSSATTSSNSAAAGDPTSSRRLQ